MLFLEVSYEKYIQMVVTVNAIIEKFEELSNYLE